MPLSRHEIAKHPVFERCQFQHLPGKDDFLGKRVEGEIAVLEDSHTRLSLPKQEGVNACQQVVDPPRLEEKIAQIKLDDIGRVDRHPGCEQEDHRRQQSGSPPFRKCAAPMATKNVSIDSERSDQRMRRTPKNRARLMDMLDAGARLLESFAEAVRQTLIRLRN